MADVSRRTALGGALLLAAIAGGAGLGVAKGVRHKIAVPPPDPPAALTDQLAAQRRLLAGYDATLAAQPGEAGRLTALRADVAAHGDALRAVLEQYPGWRLAESRAPRTGGAAGQSASPSNATSPPTDPAPVTVAGLAAGSGQARTLATSGCVGWPSGEPQAARAVPLLGSIAACLATHARVLG